MPSEKAFFFMSESLFPASSRVSPRVCCSRSAAPLAASAHVTVNPNTADPGSYATVQFRVPNESETATTTRVEVQLPTDTPFIYAAYEPIPGSDDHRG